MKPKPRVHRLAFLGDTAGLAELIRKGVPIDEPNWEDSCTPLHLAADEGHIEAVRILLEAGADPLKKCDHFRDCALHTASYRGHTEIADLLLRAGTPVDVLDCQNRTPLHNAAEGGHGTLTVTRLLVKRGANIHAVERDGYTPLHLAALSQDLSVTFLLLSIGADPHQKNGFNQNALDIAIEQFEAIPRNPSGGVKAPCADNAKYIRDLIRLISDWSGSGVLP